MVKLFVEKRKGKVLSIFPERDFMEERTAIIISERKIKNTIKKILNDYVPEKCDLQLMLGFFAFYGEKKRIDENTYEVEIDEELYDVATKAREVFPQIATILLYRVLTENDEKARELLRKMAEISKRSFPFPRILFWENLSFLLFFSKEPGWKASGRLIFLAQRKKHDELDDVFDKILQIAL